MREDYHLNRNAKNKKVSQYVFRNSKAEWQIIKLNHYLATYPQWDTTLMRSIAEETNLTYRQVYKWFWEQRKKHNHTFSIQNDFKDINHKQINPSNQLITGVINNSSIESHQTQNIHPKIEQTSLSRQKVLSSYVQMKNNTGFFKYPTNNDLTFGRIDSNDLSKSSVTNNSTQNFEELRISLSQGGYPSQKANVNFSDDDSYIRSENDLKTTCSSRAHGEDSEFSSTMGDDAHQRNDTQICSVQTKRMRKLCSISQSSQDSNSIYGNSSIKTKNQIGSFFSPKINRQSNCEKNNTEYKECVNSLSQYTQNSNHDEKIIESVDKKDDLCEKIIVGCPNCNYSFSVFNCYN